MTSAPNLILDPVLEAANDDVEHGDAAYRDHQATETAAAMAVVGGS